jgi:hypothetical protein
MAGKPRPLILEKKDFYVYLMARLHASFGGSVEALGEHLGVTASRVYAMLSDVEGPTDEMLKRLGLRLVYVMEAQVPEPQEPDEPPSKPAKGKK